MATTIRCDIVSAEAEIFTGEATMIVATGEMGELGIAPRHAPLITRLKPGKVVVTTPAGELLDFAISGGILEVQPQVVTILADTGFRYLSSLYNAEWLRSKGLPVFPWLYRNVPSFDMFQSPARFSLWAVFSLALLAGIGAGQVVGRHHGGRQRLTRPPGADVTTPTTAPQTNTRPTWEAM